MRRPGAAGAFLQGLALGGGQRDRHAARQIPLCRLRYGGSAHSFGFAIYSAARTRYEDSVLRTGLPTGTLQEALDTACTTHLAGLSHDPDPAELFTARAQGTVPGPP